MRAMREQLQNRLRSLLVMELLDSLLDDETLVRRPETPVPAVIANHRELREAHRNLLATLVVADRRLAELARQIAPVDSIPVSVIISGGAGGLLALARQEAPGIKVRLVEQMRERFAVEALPEHGRRLKRGLVGRGEAIEPRLHEALHRARYSGVLALLGVPQKLLQEQGIAGCASQRPRSLRETAQPGSPLPPAAAARDRS